MSQQPTKVELGAFAHGSVPPDLVITYTDFDGNAVDLGSFGSVWIEIQEDINANTLTLGQGSISISTPAEGKVTYQWHRNDMWDVGDYTAIVWVSDGNKYYDSDLYLYTVYDAPGEQPT